jgi:hypothetical protein
MLHTVRFSLQNVIYFIMLLFLAPLLFTFYVYGVLKFKYKTPVPEGSKVKIHSEDRVVLEELLNAFLMVVLYRQRYRLLFWMCPV